jgi:hypothetical protein
MKGSYVRAGKIAIHWSPVWQRLCYYVDTPTVGWHILGFVPRFES